MATCYSMIANLSSEPSHATLPETVLVGRDGAVVRL
jgi:hypothetical protein